MSKRSLRLPGRATSRLALALLAALSVAHARAPRASARQKEAPASVSGRVREGERGVAGITVVLMQNDPGQRSRQVARARTDGEGRYQLAGVAPGRYQIVPVSPVHVVEGLAAMESWPPGRPLTLLAGEDVKDVDFSVQRGGVITGRITDGDGNPVIGEPVMLEPADGNTPQLPRAVYESRDNITDDRGVYRVYGLAPGVYRVSVGIGGASGAVSFGRRRVFEKTFFPGVTEQAQARLVEVKSGEESDDIDIAIGRALKTYRASGRFVDASTGAPVAGINYAYSTADRRGGIMGSFGGSVATNANGEFQTEGLAPGHYSVFAMPSPRDSTEFYSDAVSFEVTNADVTGLVVPLKRGASVSGVVTVEGVADPALRAKLLAQVRVFGWVETGDRAAPPSSSRTDALGPDGGFVLTGLRPGKLRLFFNDGQMSKSLSLMRVELNGAPVGNDGIRVTEGAQVAGVRLRLSYGTGVIRGQTAFLNGTLPPGARVIVMAHALGAAGGPESPNAWRRVEADVRGFFRIEGLPPGEYEVMANIFGGGPGAMSDRLHVVVNEGAETNASPTFDFGKLQTAPPRVDKP